MVAAACAAVAQRPASRLAQLAQALNANTERQTGIVNSCIFVYRQLQSTVRQSRGHVAPYVPLRVCNVCWGAHAVDFAEGGTPACVPEQQWLQDWQHLRLKGMQ